MIIAAGVAGHLQDAARVRQRLAPLLGRPVAAAALALHRSTSTPISSATSSSSGTSARGPRRVGRAQQQVALAPVEDAVAPPRPAARGEDSSLARNDVAASGIQQQVDLAADVDRGPQLGEQLGAVVVVVHRQPAGAGELGREVVEHVLDERDPRVVVRPPGLPGPAAGLGDDPRVQHDRVAVHDEPHRRRRHPLPVADRGRGPRAPSAGRP